MKHDCPWGWRVCTVEERCYLCVSDKVKALELQVEELQNTVRRDKIAYDTLARSYEELLKQHDGMDRFNGELVEALQHMKMCLSCGEDGWNFCEGGRQAQAALDKATTPEKRKYLCPKCGNDNPKTVKCAACPMGE